MERLELGDVLVIAESHTGIDAKRLARIDRVVALVQSALAAPFAGFGDVVLFPTLEAKAARSTAPGSPHHPLPDGNKRTAWWTVDRTLCRSARRSAPLLKRTR